MLKYINGSVLDTADGVLTKVTEAELLHVLQLGIQIQGVSLVGNVIKYTEKQKPTAQNGAIKGIALDGNGYITCVHCKGSAGSKACPSIDLSAYKGLSDHIELDTNAHLIIPDDAVFFIPDDFTVKTSGTGFFDLRGINSQVTLIKFRKALISSGFGSLLDKLRNPTESYSSYSIRLGFIILSNKQFDMFLS